MPGGRIQLGGSGLSESKPVLALNHPVTVELLNCPPFGRIAGPNTFTLTVYSYRDMKVRVQTTRIVLIRVPPKVCGT
jgi:hypothetical protein